MDIILKYFENINKEQISQFEMLYGLYEDWNNKINVISRKDFHNFYVNHVLHSLSILKFFEFKANTNFLDVGTGGGFPGIPLAICLPDCKFTLNDSIQKKIKVVENVVDNLKLNNVDCISGRVENINKEYDYVLGRAVTNLPDFVNLVRKKISLKNNNIKSNGIIYLKGGNFNDEIKSIKLNIEDYCISKYFEEDFFETKKIVYIYNK